MKIALISSVLPKQTIGGEVVLWRHLRALTSRHPHVQVKVISVGQESMAPLASDAFPARMVPPRRCLGGLARTRLARVRNQFLYDGWCVSRNRLLNAAGAFGPDLILTVAHGELIPHVIRIARRLRVPVHTFVHDWWPDTPEVVFRGTLDRSFARLLSMSRHCYCVSQEMLQAVEEIGGRASILYPMPATITRVPREQPPVLPEESLCIAYSGNLNEAYGEMLRDLLGHADTMPELSFAITGHPNDWPSRSVERYSRELMGYLSDEAFETLLHSADLFLVLMSFQPSLGRRMRTSFPSKLVQFMQYGKPVFIWGPASCSAIQWARRTGYPYHCSDPNPAAAAVALKRMAAVIQGSREDRKFAPPREFTPEYIQSEFEKHLLNA